MIKNINQQDLDILLAASARKSKEFIITHPKYKPNIFARLKLAHYLRLYKKRYSVAAIVKHKEFYGLNFFVNRHVLIPRPETEMMVEEAMREISKSKCQMSNQTQNPKSKIIFIDVGTGSGCIPISILNNLRIKQFNNLLTTIATDISRKALKVAKKNAKRHNVKIKFLRGNLLEPILNNRRLLSVVRSPKSATAVRRGPAEAGKSEVRSPIIITANLPYLTEEQFRSEKSIQKEPKTALVADSKNGLLLYEELFKQIRSLLLIVSLREIPRRGMNCSLLIIAEIDPRQTADIIPMIKKYFPQSHVEIKKDHAGQDRVACVSLNT